MTKALPFTAASLARAIKGAELAGKRVAGVGPDGSLILGDISERSPLNSANDAQADPFVAAAGNARNAKTKRGRNRATS